MFDPEKVERSIDEMGNSFIYAEDYDQLLELYRAQQKFIVDMRKKFEEDIFYELPVVNFPLPKEAQHPQEPENPSV